MGVLSTSCMAARELLSKHLAAHATGTASAFATFLFALPWYLVIWFALRWAGFEQAAVLPGFWFWVILRSTSDVGAEWCKMLAISRGDISLVSCVLALTPAVLVLLSPAITGDPLSTLGAAGLFVVVGGSIFAVYRPGKMGQLSDGTSPKAAIGFGLASTMFFALNNCFDRLTVESAPPVFSGMVMTLFSGAVLAPIALRGAKNRSDLRGAARVFLLRGLFEVLFMSLRLSAMVVISAPVMAAIQRLALLLTILGGRVFFGELDTGRRLTGGLIVLVGTAIILYGEYATGALGR